VRLEVAFDYTLAVDPLKEELAGGRVPKEAFEPRPYKPAKKHDEETSAYMEDIAYLPHNLRYVVLVLNDIKQDFQVILYVSGNRRKCAENPAILLTHIFRKNRYGIVVH